MKEKPDNGKRSRNNRQEISAKEKPDSIQAKTPQAKGC
jgi:hypothetical protein